MKEIRKIRKFVSSFSLNTSLKIFKASKQYFKNKGTRRFEDLYLSSRDIFLNYNNFSQTLFFYSRPIYIYIFTSFLETGIIWTPPYPVKENYLLFARIPASLHRWSSPMFAVCRDSYIDTFKPVLYCILLPHRILGRSNSAKFIGTGLITFLSIL